MSVLPEERFYAIPNPISDVAECRPAHILGSVHCRRVRRRPFQSLRGKRKYRATFGRTIFLASVLGWRFTQVDRASPLLSVSSRLLSPPELPQDCPCSNQSKWGEHETRLAGRTLQSISWRLEGRKESTTLRGLTQFSDDYFPARPSTAESKSHSKRVGFEGAFCDNQIRTACNSLILNGEMSEWSIEHAWK